LPSMATATDNTDLTPEQLAAAQRGLERIKAIIAGLPDEEWDAIHKAAGVDLPDVVGFGAERSHMDLKVVLMAVQNLGSNPTFEEPTI